MNKKQLDRLGTFLGLIAGITGALATNDVYPKTTGSIAGISTFCLGWLVQRPATKHPTTEDIEEKAND